MASGTTRNLFLQVSGDISPFKAAMAAAKPALQDLSKGVDVNLAAIEERLKQFGNQSENYVAAFRRTFSAVSGGLDLGASQDALAASEQRAATLRMQIAATDAALAKDNEYDSELKLLAVSLRAAAAAEDANVTALRRQVGALQLVVPANDQVVASHGRMGASGMIADHVIRSFTDSVVAGQSPVRAFAMEIPRVGEALQFWAMQSEQTEGKLGKLASFLGGPWGIAFNAAIGVGSLLASSLLSGGEAADKDTDSTKSLIDAINALDEASQRSIRTSQESAQAALNDARAKVGQAQATREAAMAKVQELKARIAERDQELNSGVAGAAGMGGAIGSAIASADQRNRLKDANSDLDNLTDALLKAQDSARRLQLPILQRQVAAATDDSAAATQRYEGTLARLNSQFQAGTINQRQYNDQLVAATRLRDVTTDHHSAPRSNRAEMTEAYDLAAANAKLSTATDAVSQAEAALDVIRAQKRNYTPAAYQEALTEAEQQIVIAKSLQETFKQISADNDNWAKGLDKAGDDQAKDALEQIRAAFAAQQTTTNAGFEKRPSGPLDDYKQRLQDAVGDTNRAFSAIKVDAFEQLEGAFEGVVSGTETVGQAVKKMVSSILADFAKLAIEKAIFSVLGGSGGSGGGFLSKIFGGGKAGGGGIDPSKFYVVGEDGPELFAPGVSGSVIPNHALRTPSLAIKSTGSAISVHLGDTHLYAPGADPAQLARLQEAFAQSQRELPSRALAAFQDARTRNIIRDTAA